MASVQCPVSSEDFGQCTGFLPAPHGHKIFVAGHWPPATGHWFFVGHWPPATGHWFFVMNCADVEILLAEYVDGTLRREAKSAVKRHMETCVACRDLAHDAAGAVAFMDRASRVEAPPELVTKLLFEVTQGSSHSVVKPPLAQRLFGKTFGSWLGPVFQPRFAMGMATTLLFFATLIRGRQLRPADLNPSRLWTVAEDQVSRTWERGVKYYENLRLVFEIQTRLKQWNEEAASAQPSPPEASGPERSGEGKK